MIDLQAIRDAHPLVDVAARYVDLKQRGREYVGLCPFHADNNPSFTLYRSRATGTWRYRCFACEAGAEGGDVIDFVVAMEGCTLTEAVERLEGERLPPPGSFKPKELPPDESDCWEPIVPVPDDAPPYDPARTFNPKRPERQTVRYKPSRIDEYRDAEGRLLCYVVRLLFDDGTKICPTITFCEGPGGQRRWTSKRMQPPFPLQGLDDLAQRPDAPVLVVEGEKCRAVAREHFPKYVVVSYMGGGEAIEQTDVGPLRERDIIYWPDADRAGRKAMNRLAERVAG